MIQFKDQNLIKYACLFKGCAFLPRTINSSKLLTTSPFLTLRQLSHILKGLLVRNSCRKIKSIEYAITIFFIKIILILS